MSFAVSTNVAKMSVPTMSRMDALQSSFVCLPWLLPASMVMQSPNGDNAHESPDGRTTAGRTVCLVTGGTGLVGRALQYVIQTEAVGSRFGKQDASEEWIFLSSKDGDLRCVGTADSLADERDQPLTRL